MTFSQATAHYHKLKPQYDEGSLTETDFKAELEKLMVQDRQGRWWMIGYETGKWYVREDGVWVRAEPPAIPWGWIGGSIASAALVTAIAALLIWRSYASCTPVPAALVVDPMESVSGWLQYHDPGSTFDLRPVSGRVRNAVQIDYDLGQTGWLVVAKEITPTLLSGTQGIRFHYTGTGHNTMEFKLLEEPAYQGAVFSYERRETASTDIWLSLEQPYNAFVCVDRCEQPDQKLDPAKVYRLEIAISQAMGGVSGPGKMVIDQIEALK